MIYTELLHVSFPVPFHTRLYFDEKRERITRSIRGPHLRQILDVQYLDEYAFAELVERLPAMNRLFERRELYWRDTIWSSTGAVEIDGNRPPYNHTDLIHMALLCAPQGYLTRAQICRWVESTFAWYRRSEVVRSRLRNGVRKTLNSGKCFSTCYECTVGAVYHPRYWCLDEGSKE